MKVLIIALDGQIRDALEAQLAIRQRPFLSVGAEWLNSDTSEQIKPQLNIPADIGVVVNALSLESLQQQASESLIDSLAMLAQACDRAVIPVISLSTSQVFDGIDGGRNREKDEVVPASREGALLARMEELLRGSCSRHIILRTGPLFSSREDNLLTTLLDRFKAQESLTLSSTGKSCPLHAKDLARVISGLIDQLSCGCNAWGTYHYCSSDPVSSYQFAETVLAVVSQYTQANEQLLQLESVDTADTDWPRP
ncbi:sugar nucleotide-binding protein [Oceanicoccus sp. KOV_DT_Chl]|uniref:sugar nucleotide-binding protein n=1 Tax=Oceanicoccus sp. KOV_DT_Chl TaxID=1904639 RepID=UPI000C7B7276|nr:sugar nucleotide-binding protein [Oceanicoccus sp. KOV_DT_Chl]